MTARTETVIGASGAEWLEKPRNRAFSKGVEKKAIRKNSRKEREEIPEAAQWYQDLLDYFDHLIKDRKPLAYAEGKALDTARIRELNLYCLRLSPVQAEKRRERIDKLIPGRGKARVLGGKLVEHANFSGASPGELERAAAYILQHKVATRKTPKEWLTEQVSGPVTQEETLRPELLDTAVEYIALSDEDSIARTLQDPIEMGVSGIVVNVRQTNKHDQINRDFTVIHALLDVLKTFKHKQSEQVFKDWLLKQLTRRPEGVEKTIDFLEVLINFTSFLDSKTHLELFKPTPVPGREREVLLNPFYCLRDSLSFVRTKLWLADNNSLLAAELGWLEVLLQLRYGEVYRGSHQASLFTVGDQALIPPPQDFAKLIYAFLHGSVKHVFIPQESKKSYDVRRIALGVVKLAESYGVTDITPVIKQFSDSPELQAILSKEAERRGLIPTDPKKQLIEVARELKYHPIRDARNINFAEIIRPDTRHVVFYFLSGTFAPLTKGHIDLIETTVDHMDRQPQHNPSGEGIQYFLLIMPITDVTNIPEYKKSAAQIGLLEQRIHPSLLQLASCNFDMTKVLITISLQPDPGVQGGVIETSIRDTFNVLMGKISDDQRLARKTGGLTGERRVTMGPDEPEWGGDPRKLLPKEMQRLKVREEGGLIVVRRGWQLAVARNHNLLRTETGTHTVIFTPGTPNSSSTAVIEEIEKTDTTNAIMPAAEIFVLEDFSKEARNQRQLHPPTSSEIKSIDEYTASLVRRVEEKYGIVL